MNTTNLKTRLENKVQTLQTTGTALATADSGYAALTANTLEIIEENLKNQPLALQLFDIVKSPSGGSTVFTVPGLSGDETERELTGIILDYSTPRAYWETSDPVEGTPPVCMSKNSIVSTDGKVCARCPFNDFGSKDGNTGAKACKESVLIFLLRPDNIMPILVRVPVSSKRIFQRYVTRLTAQMIPVSGVVTKITLERATSRGGKPYALYRFEAAAVLTSEESAKIKAFSQQFMAMLNAAELEPAAAQKAD